MVQAVAAHRLDRMKTGKRTYADVFVPDEVLDAARRCILHATGMHSLTVNW
jgi:mRNA interferase MazF